MSFNRICVQGAVIAAALTVVLGIVDGVLFFRNQSLQAQVDKRQRFINETANLARISETLTRALASSAYTNKDDAIKQMLHEQGIDYTVNPAPTAPGTPPATPAGK